LQFWDELESGLFKSLKISSIKDVEQGRKNLKIVLEKVLKEKQYKLNPSEITSLLDQLIDHFFGFGILESLLRDVSITMICVNNFEEIFISR
jgi:Flp pilus assembly CpaF family ATPase